MTSSLLESLPEHIRKPHIRPIQPIGVQKDGQQYVALRDPTQVVRETMVIMPQALQLLQRFTGTESLDVLATQFNSQLEQVLPLVQQLDRFGLLWGPTFEKLEQDLKVKLAERGAIPAYIAYSTLGQTADACRNKLDEFFAQTEDPELDAPAVGIIAPHLDYPRGWPNYAAAYRTLQGAPAPDRVVLLGTNHFGLGDGVVVTEYGYESPMGRCPADTALVLKLADKLGKKLIIDQLDCLHEHSTQLHIPWLQHRFGNVPVLTALIPDPLKPMIKEDDERVAFAPFVAALQEALDAAGGRTIFVASSDLSHVGPQFGEPRPVDQQRKTDVERHDREMMSKYLSGDADAFLDAMKWNKNPTRWCSIGNMAAALMLAKPSSLELVDYRQACDEKGTCMVTSAAIAMLKN